MKKTYTKIKALLALLSLSALGANAQYCPQQATTPLVDDEIAYFSLANITNTSVCGTPGTGPGSIPGGYANYTGGGATLPNVLGTVPAATLIPGQAYPITVGLTMCSTGVYSAGWSVWIDYNQDGDFADPGENVITNPTFAGALASNVAPTPSLTYATFAPFTVPATAAPGLTRLRIAAQESAIPTLCTNFTWGEVEDYCVYIPPCTSAPAQAVAVVNTPSVCPGIAVTLSMTPPPTSAGLSYQWEYSTNGPGGPWTQATGGNGSTSPIYVTPTLSATYLYRSVVTCTVGSPSPATMTTTPVNVNVGAPAVSNATTQLPLLCPGMSSSLAISSPYQGVSYQWQTGTVNIVGPYFAATAGTTAATSGTLSTYVSPTLNIPTFFQAILTCTAVPSLSTIINPVAINIAGTTTNSVPYHEGFEALGVNNFMPNCSWAASNPTVINQTYTTAASLFRQPNNGSGFASFKSGTNPLGDYFYTNGIQLEPGITYSASIDYIADGAIGWNELSLWVGTSQTVPTLTNIVSANASIIANTYYKNLSNTFTVGTSGLYYIAIKAKGTGANYLSFDDVWVTAPCSANSPTLAVNGPTAVCSGQSFVYSASGADSYVWTNNGTTASTVALSLTGNANVVVVGMNAASGCTTAVSTVVNVNQSPPIGINVVSNNTNTYVCKGSSVSLAATGAGQGGIYSWSTGTTAVVVSVSPTVATTYTVVGTNVNGCSASAVQAISVKNLPNVSALTSAAQICAKESATLTATGANTYTWSSSNIYILGTQVIVNPNITTSYTVVGSDQSKCEASAVISVGVNECVGLSEINSSADGINVYPNPNAGQFTLEFNNDNTRSIEVVDVTGRLVFATNSSELKTSLNISSAAAGIYYVKIRDSKTSSVLKIVKD